jgi:hypothetical protein
MMGNKFKCLLNFLIILMLGVPFLMLLLTVYYQFSSKSFVYSYLGIYKNIWKGFMLFFFFFFVWL